MTTEPTAKHQQEAREIVERLFGHGEHPLDEQLISDIALTLSSRDAEVREVLEGLRDDDSGCWCVHFGSEYHTNACLAARGLWNRLQS